MSEPSVNFENIEEMPASDLLKLGIKHRVDMWVLRALRLGGTLPDHLDTPQKRRFASHYWLDNLLRGAVSASDREYSQQVLDASPPIWALEPELHRAKLRRTEADEDAKQLIATFEAELKEVNDARTKADNDVKNLQSALDNA